MGRPSDTVCTVLMVGKRKPVLRSSIWHALIIAWRYVRSEKAKDAPTCLSVTDEAGSPSLSLPMMAAASLGPCDLHDRYRPARKADGAEGMLAGPSHHCAMSFDY